MRLSIVFLLLLAGCQTGPTTILYKQGSTFAQRQNAADACNIAALKAVPQSTAVASTPGYYNPGYTTCTPIGNSVSCSTVGGGYTPGSVYSYDPNQKLRNRQFAKCIVNKGFIAIEKPICPADSTAKYPHRQPSEDQIQCVPKERLVDW
ncbi:hypothetical protein [uncultured Roseibium sp.]|uniref:hypothetical protein n=1 Tax=uncultured Roseibium sp. TaxID=1936171 RepID=UPI00261E58A3|nr:hypothetical protein [uncultured Roseibium sp.]